MIDDRDIDITEDENIIDSVGEVVHGKNDILGGKGKVVIDSEVESIIAEVKNIDDAFRAVDNSGLSPAPASIRPVVNTLSSYPAIDDNAGSRMKPPASGQRLDKYGLPVAPPDRAASKDSQNLLAPVRAIAASMSLVPARTAAFVKSLVPIAGFKTGNIKETKLPGGREAEVEMPDFNEPKIDKGPPDFKMKFDFESAYRDPPENRPLRRRRERRTGLVGGIMYACFILCIGVVLASMMWMATIDVLGFASEDETVDIHVPDDFTMDTVTDMLYEADLIRYKGLFNLFADYSNAEEKISPGQYVLNKNYDYRALVQGMTARAGIRVETTVVIPEGFTMAQIFNLLENEGVCSADELWEAATYHDFNFYFLDKETLGDRLRLEGFLFPDTYNFYKDSTPVRAITRMLRGFDDRYAEHYINRADYLGYTIREIITIASMIEREAGNDEERPRIAAVIYNRLNNPASFPMLEIDATIHYAIAGKGIPFSTTFDNEYNTYLYPGLPPGPIANPGLASIQAALYPQSSNEYYYALNKNGTHNFFRNAADHVAFVNSDEYGG